jgi:NAD(P) transhydrogenase subunit alpha
MKLGVVTEIATGERRVAVVPKDVARFVEAGHEVRVQAGAGERAFIDDSLYRESGAEVAEDAKSVFGWAEVLPKVNGPILDTDSGVNEVGLFSKGSALVCFFLPHETPDVFQKLADQNITLFSMNRIPRFTRAQSMDALSSQATVSGYKAALLGAQLHSRFFPMLMTAAGTIPPAKVLVLGAGVAGLQAIATAMRLGAVVEAFDIRPEAKEEVESLGAKFIDVHIGVDDTADEMGYAKEISEEEKEREREVLVDHIRKTEVIITTALVPGKPAPRLITKEAVKSMRSGSVIVDLAAETGGNCELTEPGQTIERYGVVIHGPLNLPSTMPFHASRMYSKNVSTFLNYIIGQEALRLDFEDEIVKSTCLAHGGKVLHE